MTHLTTYIQQFQKQTGYDLLQYIRECRSFLTIHYPLLKLFYQRGEPIQSISYKALYFCIQETNKVLELFNQNQSYLTNSAWWELLDIVEQIDSQLKTCLQLPKWSRSSITTLGYSPVIQLDYVLKAGQTIERVTQDVMRSTNPNDDWANISLSNQLREEDYTIEGGAILSLSIPQVNGIVDIESVVATINGKSIYGQDLSRTFEFIQEDLKTLSYEETALQSIEILVTLKRNDHPGYPNDGLQEAFLAGGNRALMNFPSIIRQLTQSFATDDSLREFAVTSLGFVEDKLSISFQVKTRLQEVIRQQNKNLF